MPIEVVVDGTTPGFSPMPDMRVVGSRCGGADVWSFGSASRPEPVALMLGACDLGELVDGDDWDWGICVRATILGEALTGEAGAARDDSGYRKRQSAYYAYEHIIINNPALRLHFI